MKLYYITGNPDKIKDAQLKLSNFPNIQIEGQKVEGIIEEQSDSIEEISMSKAKQAYEVIKQPLIVNDSGWYIPALNGFPGVYMSYVNKCFTAADFLNLMKDKSDQSIILREVVTYIDENQVKQFKHEFKGEFAKEPAGEGRVSDTIVKLGNSGKTLAENQALKVSSVDSAGLWQELAEWLDSKD